MGHACRSSPQSYHKGIACVEDGYLEREVVVASLERVIGISQLYWHNQDLGDGVRKRLGQVSII